MAFLWFISILVFLMLIDLIVMLLIKGDQKVFVKRTIWYLLIGFFLFGLLGMTGWLIRPPAVWEAAKLQLIMIPFFLGAGWLHDRLTYGKLNIGNDLNFGINLTFSILVYLVFMTGFAVVFWLFEKTDIQQIGYAWLFVVSGIIFFIPTITRKAFRDWENIPVKKIIAWMLPYDQEVPRIEPGKAMILHFQIPAKYKAHETIKFNIRAPIEKSIGEIFHILLHKHNVKGVSYQKIEIAEGGVRSKVYGWQFYIQKKTWWGWERKIYLDPLEKIKQLAINNGEVIFTKRVRSWE